MFCRALVRSPFGAVLRGIRENEAKTLSLGYNTRLYKIAVVAISFALGGLAGALYAPFAGFANTELLFWLLSGQVLIMVIVGGSGTLIGPIIGAAFFLLSRAPALLVHRGLGAVLRPDLHRRSCCSRREGIWGLATTGSAHRAGGGEGSAMAEPGLPRAPAHRASIAGDRRPDEALRRLVAVDDVDMQVEAARCAP